MTFVAGAVIWGAYTLLWWGWEALTDRVPPGAANTIWWPSIKDLVVPGAVGRAVPVKLARTTTLDPNAAYDQGGVAAAQNTGGHSLPTGPGVTTPSTGTSSNPVRGA